MPVETLNPLQNIAEAINSSASVVDAITNTITLNSSIKYVNTQFDNIRLRCVNYDTRDESNIKFLNNSYKLNTYNKSEVDLRLSSLIGSAPAIDTSVELATALANDRN